MHERIKKAGICARILKVNKLFSYFFIILITIMIFSSFTSSASQENMEDNFLFSFVHITDTQYYSRDYAHIFVNITSWISLQEDIIYVVHTGDLVQNWDNEMQWNIAKNAMNELSQPFGACPGNHDNYAGVNNSNYIRYFGDVFHYDIVHDDFVFIYLPYCTNQTTLDWMENVIQNHPDFRIVICTHAYLTPHSPDFSRIENGTAIWSRIKKYQNVFGTLSGHMAYPGVIMREDLSNHNTSIIQIQQDYQELDQGGHGLLNIYKVFTDRMEVYEFSPYIDKDEDLESKKILENYFTARNMSHLTHFEKIQTLTDASLNVNYMSKCDIF